MRKVKTFKRDWVHEIEKDINDWSQKNKNRIISTSISPGQNGEYISIVTYEEDPEQSLLS